MTARFVDHVVVTVQDIDAAVDTWEAILGVPVTHRADLGDVGIRQAFFSLDTGFIELIAPIDERSPLAGRPDGLSVLALQVDDVDATVAVLEDRGMRVDGKGTSHVMVHPSSATGVRVQLWPRDRPHRWRDGDSG